jgi:hypothetical protein
MSIVSHVAHIATALRIIQDKRIAAGLVFDKSKLNTKRILVTWLSPNDWSGTSGFRYGNIRFRYKLDDLIADKRFYWVESIAYSIPACRILLTKKEHELPIYDPADRTGPWWFNKEEGRHYFNSNYCLELMFEDDIPVTESTKVDFVNHHDNYCSVHRYNPKKCAELGIDAHRAGGRFLAAAIATGTDISDVTFGDSGDPLSFATVVGDAFSRMVGSLKQIAKNYSGSVVHGGSEAIPLARAVLNAVAFHRDDVPTLAGLFRGEDDLIKTCAQVIADSVRSVDSKTLLEALN